MIIWIQALSWTLIYALGQGLVVFAALWLILKLIPSISSKGKYHLALASLTLLFGWFVSTLISQYQLAAEEIASINTLSLENVYFIQSANSASGSFTGIDFLRSLIAVISPYLSALYIVGFTLMVIRLSYGFTEIYTLKRSGVSKPEDQFNDLLQSIKNRLEYSGAAELWISAKAKVPMVIGFVKPIILLPAATVNQLTIEELETILLHELAHIKRYDFVVNILQSIAETVLFFNPFIWMISGIIRREREHCCDDLVLSHTKEPIYYARALTTIASNSASLSSLTIAASGKSSHLLIRIKRIMEMPRNPFSYSRMIAAIAIIGTICFSVAWIDPSMDSKEISLNEPKKSAAEIKRDSIFNIEDSKSNFIIALVDNDVIDPSLYYVIERKGMNLYINNQLQSVDLAAKYLPLLVPKEVKLNVFPHQDRQLRNPRASTLQFIPPILRRSGNFPRFLPYQEGC